MMISALERLLSPELWLRIAWKIVEIAIVLAAARLLLALSDRLLKKAFRLSGKLQHVTSERRARALVAMLHRLITYLIILTAALVILGRLGVSATSLITGGAIAGLAITFGAQNLIRDLFTGIALLIADAFAIGDRITVTGVTGEVIEIGLRMVKLRGEDGTVHFVPYGAITTVSNLSRGAIQARLTGEKVEASEQPSAEQQPPEGEF